MISGQPQQQVVCDVFVSYSSANRQKAETVFKDLSDSGLQVWFDRRRIRPGDNVRDAINSGLDSSRAIVLLASQASLRSPWVLKELDAAMCREIHEQRTILIALLMGSIKNSDLPADIRGKSYIDLRGGFQRRYATERMHLINAVRALLVPVDHGRNVIPMGDQAIRHIMGYKYMALSEAREVPDGRNRGQSAPG